MTGFFRPGPVVRLFAAGLLIAGVMAVQVIGQPKDKAKPKDPPKDKAKPKDPPKGKAAEPVKAKLNEKEVVRHNKKKAKKYDPFKMRDPSKPKDKGNLVKGDYKLPKLPDGRQVTAKQYFDELNGVEKKMVAYGYSHRDPIKKGIATVLTKSEQKLDEQVARVKKLKSTLFKFDKTKQKVDQANVKRDDHAKQFKTALKDDKKRVDAIKKALAKKKVAPRGAIPARTTKSWEWIIGRRNIVAGELKTKLETKGDSSGLSIVGSATANAFLVNNSIGLLDANGSLNVPRQGMSKANLAVTVMGQRVYNFQKDVNTTFEKKDEFKKTLDKSATFTANIGPISVAAKVGVQGMVGLRYLIGLRPLYCNAQVVPYAQVKAYAQATVNLVIGKAGADGKLTVIDAEVRVGGKLALRFQNNKVSLEENAYIYANVNMLAGSLFLYLDMTVPKFGIPPWHKKRWTWDMWKWTGIKYAGYLVNVTKTHNL